MTIVQIVHHLLSMITKIIIHRKKMDFLIFFRIFKKSKIQVRPNWQLIWQILSHLFLQLIEKHLRRNFWKESGRRLKDIANIVWLTRMKVKNKIVWEAVQAVISKWLMMSMIVNLCSRNLMCQFQIHKVWL